jgi:hypothetical protein
MLKGLQDIVGIKYSHTICCMAFFEKVVDRKSSTTAGIQQYQWFQKMVVDGGR